MTTDPTIGQALCADNIHEAEGTCCPDGAKQSRENGAANIAELGRLRAELDQEQSEHQATLRNQSALSAEVQRLRAELAEVRNQAHRDQVEHQQILRAKNELADELDAARPVVDAAKAWRDLPGFPGPRAAALAAAVDALEAAHERANCPACRAEKAGAAR